MSPFPRLEAKVLRVLDQNIKSLNPSFEAKVVRVLDKRLGRSDPSITSKVESGPFAGLSLTTQASWGGQAARLVGTYEMELWPVIHQLSQLGISHVIDVGCADGYYACGIPYLYPEIRMTAFDLSITARCQTRYAASANALSSRVTVKRFFDITTFQPFNNERELLLLDCEGFEQYIITPETVNTLIPVCVLVECHDMFVPGVTAQLETLLSKTHAIQQIHSVERSLSDVPEGVERRPTLLQEIQELRAGPQTWIWAVPRAWK